MTRIAAITLGMALHGAKAQAQGLGIDIDIHEVVGTAGAVAVAAGCHGAGHSESSLGASTGIARYPNDDSSQPLKVLGSCQGHDLPLLFDWNYVVMGGESESAPAYDITFRGVNASVGWVALGSAAQGRSAWIKAGYYDGETEFTSPGPPYLFSESSNGASVGLGASWKFFRRVGLRAEYEVLFDVAESPGGRRNVPMVSVGIYFFWALAPTA